MSGFEAINEVTELTENLTDVVKDVAENVGDFARDAMEHFNEQGIKDLQEGDLEGAIDNSDLDSSDKKEYKEIAEIFDLGNKTLFTTGAQVVGGALGTIAALITPGVQAAGFVSAAACVNGMSEFKKAWDQNQMAKAAASANAMV